MAIPAPPFTIPWKWIGVAVAALVIVSTVFFSIQAYGNSRFEAGEAKADAAWAAAADKLEEESKASATAADVPAIERQIEYNEKLAEEKDKIDEASETGGSVFDVMFDTDGV